MSAVPNLAETTILVFHFGNPVPRVRHPEWLLRDGAIGDTQGGARGHPIIFSPRLFAGFATLKGDRGAYSLLLPHEA